MTTLISVKNNNNNKKEHCGTTAGESSISAHTTFAEGAFVTTSATE